MARYMRTDLGRGHSRLIPPVVIGARPPFGPLSVRFAPLFGVADRQRRAPSSFLRAPQVLAAVVTPNVFAPIAGKLTPLTGAADPHRRPLSSVLRAPVLPSAAGINPPANVQLFPLSLRLPSTTSRLSPPAVVAAAPPLGAKAIKFFPLLSRRPQIKSRLAPPTVVERLEIVAGTNVVLAYQSRGYSRSVLQPPAVVGVAAVPPEKIHSEAFPFLPEPLRRSSNSRLNPPAVVGAAPSEQVFTGPRVSLTKRRIVPVAIQRALIPTVVLPARAIGGVGIALAAIRPRLLPLHALRAPMVVSAGISEFHAPISGKLAPLLGPADRHYRVQSQFIAPVVVSAPAVEINPPLAIYLFPLVGFASPHHRLPVSRLGAPVAVIEFTFYAGYPILAASRRQILARSILRPPAVVTTVVVEVAPPIHKALAQISRLSSRYQQKSNLQPPTVIFISTAFYGPIAILAYSRRGVARSELSAPQVVEGLRIFATSVNLAYSRRGAPRSELRAPEVIDFQPQVYYVAVTLAPSRRGVPKSVLRAPTDTVGLEDQGTVEVSLAPSSRLATATTYKLFAPSVVFGPALISYGPTVNFTYALRGQPVSALRAPTVIWPFVVPTISFTLAPNTDIWLRRRTTTLLTPPTVVNYPPLGLPVGPITTLTYSLYGKPRSHLYPPAVIGVGVFYEGVYGESFPLFPEPLRRQPKSRLSPPTVLLAPPIFFGPAVSLAPSSRGLTKPFLSPPVVVAIAAEHRPLVATTLAYSRRGLARPLLSPPAIVAIAKSRFEILITLAPQRRGQPKSALLPPAVVFPPFIARETLVSLAYSRRGVPKSTLRAPAVVSPILYFGPSITLAPQSRGAPKSQLAVPTVILQPFVAQPLRIAYTRIKVPYAQATIFPPTVVTIPEPVLWSIQVVLAYSLRGKPKPFFITEAPGLVTGHGDVCGDDQAGSIVQGTSAAQSTICADESSVGSVCGDDHQAT